MSHVRDVVLPKQIIQCGFTNPLELPPQLPSSAELCSYCLPALHHLWEREESPSWLEKIWFTEHLSREFLNTI